MAQARADGAHLSAMKPVLILQHLSTDGPAYLRAWLEREGVPFVVCNSDEKQAYPTSVGSYRALAVLGGEMSANDPLPSLRDAERLIVEAVHADIPVIGHCLGGQLMARALGAKVDLSPAPEIGWHRIRLLPHGHTAKWFGEGEEAVVFQWHYDAFELPEGAQWIATSDACPHQAFSLGRHLAMQFHVELDETKLRQWCAAHDDRFISASRVPTVHGTQEMLDGIAKHLAAQQALADRIYRHWLS